MGAIEKGVDYAARYPTPEYRAICKPCSYRSPGYRQRGKAQSALTRHRRTKRHDRLAGYDEPNEPYPGAWV